jgi:hypothetical protein
MEQSSSQKELKVNDLTIKALSALRVDPGLIIMFFLIWKELQDMGATVSHLLTIVSTQTCQ